MIIAIDPSLTGTAVCIGRTIEPQRIKRFGSVKIGDRVVDRVDRYEHLVHEVMDWIGDIKPKAIFIEAYSFGSNDASAKYIAEYGGILRWHLTELTKSVYEVAPTTLKKFATGKGNAKKDVVAAHLAARYRVMFGNSDEFDAFGLYQLGLVALGYTKAPTQQMATVAANAIVPF